MAPRPDVRDYKKIVKKKICAAFVVFVFFVVADCFAELLLCCSALFAAVFVPCFMILLIIVCCVFADVFAVCFMLCL